MMASRRRTRRTIKVMRFIKVMRLVKVMRLTPVVFGINGAVVAVWGAQFDLP